MSNRTVLFTGYGPYPGVSWNPSGDLVGLLAAHGAAHASVSGAASFLVATATLPVEYDAVAVALAETIERHQPNALVMLGLRPSGLEVCVERVALNLDDAAKTDNRGNLRQGTAIDADGPPAFISALPVEAMRAEFTAAGVPASVSNHAGAYICNRTYYLAQRDSQRSGRCLPCVFIHLPWIGQPGVQRADSNRELELNDLIEPVLKCGAVLLSAAAVGERLDHSVANRPAA